MQARGTRRIVHAGATGIEPIGSAGTITRSRARRLCHGSRSPPRPCSMRKSGRQVCSRKSADPETQSYVAAIMARIRMSSIVSVDGTRALLREKRAERPVKPSARGLNPRLLRVREESA